MLVIAAPDGLFRLFAYYILMLDLITITMKTYQTHWTIFVRYILLSLSVRLSIFSPLNYLICCIWGCVFSAYRFPLWWLWTFLLHLVINMKSEIWIIIHYFGLGHGTMVCAVCHIVHLILVVIRSLSYLNVSLHFRHCWASNGVQ